MLAVIAKYAWQISFGLSPLVSATVTRGSAGKPGGGGNRGWKPPTARAKPLTPGDPAERRRAGEREAAAQLGVDEHRVEGGRARR